MTRKIDLFKALEQFGDLLRPAPAAYRAPAIEEDAAPDPAVMDDILLYEYIQDLLPADQKEKVEKRLESDADYREQLRIFREDVDTAIGFDIAPPPKRAASPGDIVRTETRDKIFQLIFRPNLKDPRRGVLVVKTQRRELEGARVIVRNSRRRDVLRGQITNGEASQIIPDFEALQMGELVVVAL